MAKEREKAEEAIKNVIYMQVGMAAELRDKLDDFVERGKVVAEKHKELDEEIRRTYKRDVKKEEE